MIVKALIQRVSQAQVVVAGRQMGAIDSGLLVFLGVDRDDDNAAAEALANRVIRYRVFADEQDKMNLSLLDASAELLVVSQFTLSANTHKGLRPSFTSAAAPEQARERYQHFVHCCRQQARKVETGEFGADMQVSLTNDGPVTFLLD